MRNKLLEKLDPIQVNAVVQLLEAMTYDSDDDLTEEDQDAIIESREYSKANPDGASHSRKSFLTAGSRWIKCAEAKPSNSRTKPE